MRLFRLVLLIVILTAMQVGLASAGTLQPRLLKTEYRVNPLGIDEKSPRLSWTLTSSGQGALQTAYRVLVAESSAALDGDRGELWDTGKVMSRDSVQVEYKGLPLRSRQKAYWKVMVWDNKGHASEWSQINTWEMGLLSRSDWTAKWIGLGTEGAEAFSSEGASWIWYPEGNPQQNAPAGDRFFQYTLQISASKKVDRATLYAIADNSYTAYVNGKQIGTGGAWQNWNRHSFEALLHPGANRIQLRANNTDGPAGLAVAGSVHFSDGTTQRLVSNSAWLSQNQEEAAWLNAEHSTANWKPALAFAPIGEAPWGTPKLAGSTPASPYLRKEFKVEKEIAEARVYVSARGLYHLYLNGKRVGNDEFTPGWTNYRVRVQYQTYDVASLLKEGTNAIGLTIGDGWYAGHIAWAGRQNYGRVAQGLAQLEVTYTDGSRTTIATNSAWQGQTGPILSSDTLMGEEYDARKEVANWNTTRADKTGWRSVSEEVLGNQTLQASVGSVVRRYTELKPQTIKKDKAGNYVLDLGQNMVGWVRLKVKGEAGSRVRIRFAEMLSPDGTIYTTNLRAARATDTYTLKGGGVETFEPSFTFHGFRYVELSGYPTVPTKDSVTGVVFTSALDHRGSFTSSSPLVNQLQHNILWGQMGNYFDVPTDCPQRDERLGWMGDAQVFIRTACFNVDVATFMTKWVQDVREAQAPDGGYSDVSPALAQAGNAAPAWGDAGVIVPWTVYTFYNDKRLLAQHFDSMVKWVEYVHTANPELIWRNKAGNNYGDWLSIGADTPREVLATAYFAYSTRLLARSAEVLGRTQDAAKYNALFGRIRSAFQKAFIAPDGRIHGNTQTCYLVALRFELMPQDLISKAQQYLTEDIERKSTHLSTGFVGVGYLNPVLTQANRNDVAYRLLLNDTYPSWGYSIRQGATTIWERWDGWTQEKGFQDPGMNSFNHYSLGSVGEWLYSTVAGIDIDPQQPGFQHIIMKPQLGGGLTFAKASVESSYGAIKSHWQLSKETLKWEITIPPNTTATVYQPASYGGKTLELGSGTYRFNLRKQ